MVLLPAIAAALELTRRDSGRSVSVFVTEALTVVFVRSRHPGENTVFFLCKSFSHKPCTIPFSAASRRVRGRSVHRPSAR